MTEAQAVAKRALTLQIADAILRGSPLDKDRALCEVLRYIARIDSYPVPPETTIFSAGGPGYTIEKDGVSIELDIAEMETFADFVLRMEAAKRHEQP